MRSLLVAALALAAGALSSCGLDPVFARDLGQWGKSDAKMREWYARQMMPDYPQSSCCGPGDAYWTDTFESDGDQYVAIITDDRDDAPLNRPHIPVGTRVVVPKEKLKLGTNDPNPTGHGVIFMGAGGTVYCYLPPVQM